MQFVVASYTVLASFTFHYGPIQITFECFTCILDTVFTFHYGPIQI